MVELAKETIAEVKKYAEKYPDLTQADLGRFLGIGQSAVSRILNGEYDDKPPIETQIPYETYRRLVMCEEVVKEILRNAKTHYGEEDLLFVDYRVLSGILARCLPEEFEAKIKELKGEKNA